MPWRLLADGQTRNAAQGEARGGGPAAPLVVLAPPPARRALVPPALANGEPLQRQRRAARLHGGAEGFAEALVIWVSSSQTQWHPLLGNKRLRSMSILRTGIFAATSGLPPSTQRYEEKQPGHAALRRSCTGVRYPPIAQSSAQQACVQEKQPMGR